MNTSLQPTISNIQSLLKEKEYTAVITLVNAEIKKGNKKGLLYYYLAKALAAEQKWLEAASSFQQSFELVPQNFGWQLEKIHCLVKAGEPKEIWIKLLKDLLQSEELSATILLRSCELLLPFKEWSLMEDIMKRVTPEGFKYNKIKALIATQKGDWTAAAQNWEQAIQLKDVIPHWWVISLMGCYQQLGNVGAIKRVVKELLDPITLSGQALRNVTQLMIQAHLFEEAKEMIAILAEKNKASAMQLLVTVAIEEGQYDKALSTITDIQALPNLEGDLLKKTYEQYFRIKSIQEDWQAIVDVGESIIESYPDFFPIYQVLIKTYNRLHQRKKRKDILTKAYYKFHKTNPEIVIKYCNLLDLHGKSREALKLLEADYQENPSLLLPLLKRYLKNGKVTLFLETIQSDFLPIKDKITVLSELATAYIRLGHYSFLPSLLESIVAIVPTNFEEHRRLILAKNTLLHFYGILNAPDVDIAVLNSEVERNTLKEHLIRMLPSTNPCQLLDSLLAVSYVDELPVVELSKSAIRQYCALMQADATALWHTYEYPSQAIRLTKYIKERIEKKIPTSLIRLGDGEGNFLKYPSYLLDKQKEDQKAIQFTWWRETKLGEDELSKDLLNKYLRAVRQADILGVTPVKQIVNTLVFFDSQQLTSYIRGIFGVLHSTMELDLKPDIWTSCNVHTDLELWNCYHYLLKDLEEISIISCHDGIDERIKERFGIPTVHQYIIPSEQHYQQMFQYEEEEEHFPTVYLKLLEVLPNRAKGQIFLVAAGFLGKIYCQLIKDHGGIALDIGSVADMWMGFITRKGITTKHINNGVRIKSLVKCIPELPVNKTLVKTNHYCDRLLPISRESPKVHHYSFLITGHPRTGTGFTSQFFTLLGHPIGHETLKEKGMASWVHAAYDYHIPFFDKKQNHTISRYELSVKHLLLLVRDPKTAIPSIIIENRVNESYNYRRFHILKERGIDLDAYDNYIEKAIVSYIEWIAIIEAQKPDGVIRLEQIEQDVLAYFSEQSIHYTVDYNLEQINNKNKTVDKFGIAKPVLTKDDYATVSPIIIEQLCSFCLQYGYSPSPFI